MNNKFESILEDVENRLASESVAKVLKSAGVMDKTINSFNEIIKVYVERANGFQTLLTEHEKEKMILRLERIMELSSNRNSIVSNFIEIEDNMNYLMKFSKRLIDRYELQPDEIKITREEFSKRYDKLIDLLNTSEENPNLVLRTKVRNKVFKVFRSKNNAIVFIGGEEKTGMPVSKEKLMEVAFENREPSYKSYEPIIVEKIFDNTIFDEIQKEDFKEDLKNSTTNGRRIQQLEDDKDKLYGEIKQLENQLNDKSELFENVKVIYEESASIKAEFENAKNAALSEIKTNASKEFWEEQIEFYSKRYTKYLWIAIIASLLLVFSIFQIDLGFAADAKAEIVKTVDVSQVKSSSGIDKVQSGLMNIDFIKYGFMILLISLAIWIIRIVMKIALSSYHLSIDAKERVTMIKTYLALIKEGNALEENDKKIMIESIFRQTTHGIVQDENSVTVTDIISSFKRK